MPKTTDAEEPGDDGRDSAEDSDEDDDDFLVSSAQDPSCAVLNSPHATTTVQEQTGG